MVETWILFPARAGGMPGPRPGQMMPVIKPDPERPELAPNPDGGPNYSNANPYPWWQPA